MRSYRTYARDPAARRDALRGVARDPLRGVWRGTWRGTWRCAAAIVTENLTAT